MMTYFFRYLSISLIIILLPLNNIHSQELKCNVSIIHSKIQGTNKQVFETLRTSINEFMNSTVWTSHVFDVKEQIECNMLLNLESQSGDRFEGSLQIQSRRPVYNSSYTTVMLNYIDNDVSFEYVEFDAIEFNESSHLSNLSSILAYYAYIIIGLDYDSFSRNGGEEFFKMAERIVTNAQSEPASGWKAYDSNQKNNRYWLVNNILDNSYSPIRDFVYMYHRHGLDLMEKNPTNARAEMINYMDNFTKVYRDRPDSYMHFMKIVIEAKEDEFISIFKEGTSDEKARAFRILNEINPSKNKEYKQITDQSN